jgi:hypothetical protein
VVGLIASVEVIISERSNLPDGTDEPILKLRRQPLVKFVVVGPREEVLRCYGEADYF